MDQLMELRPPQYAQVPNEAADTLPDLNSVGLLTIMLRHAPGYRFTVADVIKKKSKIPGPKLGKTAAYGAMDTLIEHRWACRVRFMCSRGHWLTGLFRTHARFTDDDFREVCRRFKAGTPIRVRCKGCAKNPEDEVQTTIRPGAKLTWSESLKAGPEHKYGHPIEELMAPGGLLSTTPSSGIPETGMTSKDSASSQVGPSSGKPTVGQPTVGEAEVFYKTGGEDSSSSSSDPDTPPTSGGLVEEEEDVPSARTTPAPADPVITDVLARTDATQAEAEAVLDSIEDHAHRNNINIGSIERYVAGFGTRDLTRHLKRIRAQQAPQSHTGPSSGRNSLKCALHQDRTVPCAMCRSEARDPDAHDDLRHLLHTQGADNRPDLVALLAALN